MIKWEIADVRYGKHEEYLAAGWEPFAISEGHYVKTSTVWFRRPIGMNVVSPDRYIPDHITEPWKHGEEYKGVVIRELVEE